MKLSDSVRRFLAAQPVGHLATIDSEGGPHVIPVCFVVLGDEILIAVDEKPKSTRNLKRLQNIERNPQVAMVVDHYDHDWSQLQWVMLRGGATICQLDESDAAAIQALRDKYPQYRAMQLAGNPLIRFRPDRCNSWSAR